MALQKGTCWPKSLKNISQLVSLVTIWLLNFGNELTWVDTLGSSWLVERIILLWTDYAQFTFWICPHYSKYSSPEVDLHHWRVFKFCFTFSAWKSCLIMHYKPSPLCITNIISSNDHFQNLQCSSLEFDILLEVTLGISFHLELDLRQSLDFFTYPKFSVTSFFPFPWWHLPLYLSIDW